MNQKLNNIKIYLSQPKNLNTLNKFLKTIIYILLIIFLFVVVSGNLKISMSINGDLDLGNNMFDHLNVKIIEDPEKIMKRSSY